MEYETRKIEKYFLENKEPKDLIQNVKRMGPKELREIVSRKENKIIN